MSERVWRGAILYGHIPKEVISQARVEIPIPNLGQRFIDYLYSLLLLRVKERHSPNITRNTLKRYINTKFKHERMYYLIVDVLLEQKKIERINNLKFVVVTPFGF